MDKQKKNRVCPHCGSTDTFNGGNPTLTTEGTQVYPYWCSACNMPFHVELKDGKEVKRGEF